MCQISDSHNISNYNSLCDLHTKYVHAMKIVLCNVYNDKLSDVKIREIDSILSNIEKFPISWEFYKHQSTKFVSDFESLVVFVRGS